MVNNSRKHSLFVKMVRVNRTQFPPKLQEEVWRRIFKITRKGSSPEALARNLAVFLTPSELAVIEKRVATLLLLEKGTSYRKIGRAIDVTRSTVSYVKHHFKRTHYPKKVIAKRHYDPYWHHISPTSEARRQTREKLERKRKWG